MIIQFDSKQELDYAFRNEAFKACAHWKPIIEKAIEVTKEKIRYFQKVALDLRKLFTTTLYIEIRQQLYKLKRQETFLAFINNQLIQIKIPERKLIVTEAEYKRELEWKNKSIN